MHTKYAQASTCECTHDASVRTHSYSPKPPILPPQVVKEYLREADSIWIVASINRAVNDKTAKNMLGETFRRELLMDGQYNNICFVATQVYLSVFFSTHATEQSHIPLTATDSPRRRATC